MNQEKIGKFIFTLRKERGLTQEELATKLGITKNAVSKWERGISLMDMSLLNPLCDILGISITELLNGEKIICFATAVSLCTPYDSTSINTAFFFINVESSGDHI